MRRVPDKQREVYLAHRDGADEDPRVVLVVTELDGAAARRFEHEVRRCMEFEHPSFTNVVDYFEDEGRHVVAFEHVEGTSLHRLMRYVEEQDERLGDGAVLHIGVGLLAALNQAHSSKTDDGKAAPIVHGQLGPHQVLISWEGTVKVMGFGLSVMFEGVGPPPRWLLPYVAPEVRRGQPHTARANVYAAGAMLWTLLARKALPEDGSRPHPLRKVRPDLPPSVTFPLDRALEPEPGKRISAKALQVGLTRAIEDADREELRWAMEVCRVRCTVEEEFLPQESLPPSTTNQPVSSSRAVGSNPPDSDMPTGVTERKNLLDRARMFGPLPWEKGDGGAGNGGVPASERQEGSVAQRPPRPSRRPRPASRRRRGRNDGSTTEASPASGPVSSADDPHVTIPAPPGKGVPAVRIEDSTLASGVPDVADGDDESVPISYPALSSRAPGSGHPAAGPAGGYHPSQFPPGVAWPGAPPSSYAPGSAYPYSVGPGGHPMPPPLGYPGTQYPAAGLVLPIKWVAAIAGTAVLSFVFGIFVSSGFDLRFGREDPPATAAPAPPPATAAPASPPTTAAPEPAPPPAPAPVATAEPDPGPDEVSGDGNEPAEEEPAEEEVEPPRSPVSTSPVIRTPDDAAELAAHKAHLLVHTDIKNAHVYVHGKYAGPAGEKHEVDCGMKYVRLGTHPNTGWLEPGRAFDIPCRTFVTMTIEPRPYVSSGRQFLK